MKHVVITEDLSKLDKETLISLVGSLITACEDEAYAYDIQDEMAERIEECVKEHDIECTMEDEDI